uniref:Uncharacterized protein n=1 Tax=Enterobacter cloacae TaxID=550 RepID=Q9REB8_ENTCL|nr:hypothetical protein [Enterobacter cloacae]
MQVIPAGAWLTSGGNPLLTLAGRHRRTVFPPLSGSVRLDAGHARNSPGPRQAHARPPTKIHGAGRT